MANEVVKHWRDCSICLEPVNNHNHYYFHVKVEHPTDFITYEVREHYVNQVITERFMNQDTQPIE